MILLRPEGGADGKQASESSANRRSKAVSLDPLLDYPVIETSVHGTHRSFDSVVAGSPVNPVRAAVVVCWAVNGLPAGPVPGDARSSNEPVAGGLPRRRRQQRLFLDVEPARFGRPRVVDRRHSGPVAPVVASDVDLRAK